MSDPTTEVVTDPNHPGIQLMRAFITAVNDSGCSHSTVLDALLSLYGQVAVQYPCCHDGAEKGMQLVLETVRRARALEHYTKQASLAALDRAAHGADPRSAH